MIIDAHCDALFQLQLAKRGIKHNRLLHFRDDPKLAANYQRLKSGSVKVQFFAIFIHPDTKSSEQWQHALEQVDLFYTEILDKNPEMKHIRSFEDIRNLKQHEIGAVLTLEGAECFGDDLVKLRTLLRFGVLSVGLTWNHANLCADGAGEPRGGGLTQLGKEAVKLLNENKILTDVSHLSDQSFWDVMDLADYVFASHSNARAVRDHKRNLPDQAIRALLQKGGQIQVVFHPSFTSDKGEETQIADLIQHIDHICSLGGEKQLGFGSDFDGINIFIKDLEHAGLYPNLINELLKHYPEELVRGFAYNNMFQFLSSVNK